MIRKVELWRSGASGTLMARLTAHLDGIVWDVIELPNGMPPAELEREGIYSHPLGRSVKADEPQAFLRAFADMFVNTSYYIAVVDEEFTTPKGNSPQ